jgi:hypothetical protein
MNMNMKMMQALTPSDGNHDDQVAIYQQVMTDDNAPQPSSAYLETPHTKQAPTPCQTH